MFIVPHGTWKDNIRSVVFDWRQRSASCSSKGRDPLVTQADLSAPRECSSAVALLHKKGPLHRRKVCANSLWLYSYCTQSSPSKSKNINYIFIYLRGLRCLSSGSKCDSLFIMNETFIFFPNILVDSKSFEMETVFTKKERIVGSGCRICRLYLSRGGRPLQWMS